MTDNRGDFAVVDLGGSSGWFFYGVVVVGRWGFVFIRFVSTVYLFFFGVLFRRRYGGRVAGVWVILEAVGVVGRFGVRGWGL